MDPGERLLPTPRDRTMGTGPTVFGTAHPRGFSTEQKGWGKLAGSCRSSLESTGRPGGHPPRALSNSRHTYSVLTRTKQGKQVPMKIFTSEAYFVPYLAAGCIPEKLLATEL